MRCLSLYDHVDCCCAGAAAMGFWFDDTPIAIARTLLTVPALVHHSLHPIRAREGKKAIR